MSSDECNYRSNTGCKIAFVTAGIGLFIAVVKYRAQVVNTLCKAFKYGNFLDRKTITIIKSVDDCEKAVKILKQQTEKYKVIGFDCEWISVKGNRRPVAMLQLSSHEGYCALFRLNYITCIPPELCELLQDESIFKVGVATYDDAKKLFYDYGVNVASTFDLRYLSTLTGHKAEGLAKLAKTHLNVQLNKTWHLACSDWESEELTMQQIEYAANDAYVAIEIFKKLMKQWQPFNFWQLFNVESAVCLEKLLPYLNVDFQNNFRIKSQSKVEDNRGIFTNYKNTNCKTQSKRRFATVTKKKSPYDNCLLEAPNGELLCTIDQRKANWYIARDLGYQTTDEPFTVRLKFEPSGRGVCDVDRFYQIAKENRCVVCGRDDAYVSKNVIPRVYRKHFPDILKAHSSHDILLLCPNCHQASNISDLKIRQQLAIECFAPLTAKDGAIQYYEVPELKQVRSAGRTLLHPNASKIPKKKMTKLMSTILTHFKETDISHRLLEMAANIEYRVENPNYTEHGAKVVQVYCEKYGGLFELERLWREHFLQTMKPKFMPPFWSVNHNASRLVKSASERRVQFEDQKIAALNRRQMRTQNTPTDQFNN